MDLSSLLDTALKAIGGGVVITAAVAWGAQRAIDQFLAGRLEKTKSELDEQLEVHRHALEREMLKAQLTTNRVHSVYPRLLEKLLRAHGAVSNLIGAGFDQMYTDYDLDDIAGVLHRMKLPGKTRASILSEFQRDEHSAIDQLRKISRRVDIRNARLAHATTHNYLLLKSLYLSPAVTAQARQVLDDLWIAWVDVDTAFQGGPFDGVSFKKSTDSARSRLKEIEEMMQQEMQPTHIRA